MTTIMFSLALFCLTVENKIKLSASKSIEVWSRGPGRGGSDSSSIYNYKVLWLVWASQHYSFRINYISFMKNSYNFKNYQLCR